MAVRVSTLWNNQKFSNLSLDSKLLYLYLVSNPSLAFSGVLTLNTDVACIQVGVSLEDFRKACLSLISSNYLDIIKVDGMVYFIIIEHFKSAPKSEATVIRLTRELNSYPKKLTDRLKELGISTDKKMSSFTKPTIDEVLKYSLSKGYKVNAETFINYYDETSLKYGRTDIWFDARGKQVRDWKGKLRRVWFKDDNKIEPVSGAPKGFEFFYVDVDGTLEFPDGWRDGEPYSKDFLVSKALNKKFRELNS